MFSLKFEIGFAKQKASSDSKLWTEDKAEEWSNLHSVIVQEFVRKVNLSSKQT